jgi:hypothetical protein
MLNTLLDYYEKTKLQGDHDSMEFKIAHYKGSSGRTPKSVVLFFYSHQSQCFSTLPQLILSQPLLKLPIFTFLALKYLYKVVFEIPN